MKNVFIDGGAGTTGLKIKERLEKRDDIKLITLQDSERKDLKARCEALNGADIAILCLPDDAAKEAVTLIENPETIVIDTSTAHRTDENFTYGFPEIAGLREKIKNSKRIANPGCHASGFTALVAPLVEKGVISPDAKLSCFSLTGYSGGGKKMIAEYESEERSPLLDEPRQYGLSQNHKHLPEMVKVCGLTKAPVFCPVVAPFYSGMEVTVTLSGDDVNGGIPAIKEVYSNYYGSGLVHYEENSETFLPAGELSGYDDMVLTVEGNSERILLISRFDNLGKGASGAAIQNMNICLGVPETLGLNLKYGEGIL